MSCRGLALVAGVACGCLSIAAQDKPAPQSYTDADAYQIYSQLVPNEEVWGSKTKLIQRETTKTSSDGFLTPERCIDPRLSEKFSEAVLDYNRVNQQQWLLQQQFPLNIPYQLISTATVQAIFNEHKGDNSVPGGPLEAGWNAFRQSYPGAGGIIVLSAVGFNHDRTRALVYSGASCGSLCGSWSFHLFEKVDGKWQPVDGIMCHTMS